MTDVTRLIAPADTTLTARGDSDDTFSVHLATSSPKDRAALVNEHVRQRLADAELCLVRLRNEANSRRDRTDDEERALVKLLDDVGSPLAYLMGYVDATEKSRR